MNLEIPTGNIAAHMPVLEEYARNCRVLIEIGAELGTGSTHAFRCGFEANLLRSRWVTVDWKDRIVPECRPRCPFWHFVLGDSRSTLTALSVEKQLDNFQADLIFIDTDHTCEQMKIELSVWSRLASSTCHWLFHDTHMNGRYNPMTDAIKRFAEASGVWEYEQLSEECHGLGTLKPRS